MPGNYSQQLLSHTLNPIVLILLLFESFKLACVVELLIMFQLVQADLTALVEFILDSF